MSSTIDPFDELAAMFLTSPSGAASASQGQTPQWNAEISAENSSIRPPAPIEVLFAGHLPVRGGLWLTPYADAVARECGCVALIRVEDDQATLQLLGPGAETIEVNTAASLQQALKSSGDIIERWIIRVPAGDSAQVLSTNPDLVTILTSADEAAIVAAYQLVKDLSQAAERLQRPLPAIGLAIVGVDSRTAATVTERLNRTTASFLGVDVKLSRCIPRIDTGIKSTRCLMFPGQSTATLRDLMTWIDQIRTVIAHQPRPSQTVAGKLYAERDANVMTAEQILREPLPQDPAPPTASPFVRPLHTKPAPLRFPVPPAVVPNAPANPMRAAGVPSSPSWTPQVEFPEPSLPDAPPPPIKLAPKPMIDIEPKGQATEPHAQGHPVALSSYVPTLKPLPFRSPGHERVELAVDEQGVLHLLTREQNLREIAVVETWARAHRELIGLACPQQTVDFSRKAIAHVFTAEPVSVADLHGSDMRLHVLAPVVVNGSTGWYAAPLNALAR